jgi:rhodanese-related sulfurtransferase
MISVVNTEELVKKIVNKENILLVEALPASYFNDGHLPGAINLNYNEPTGTILETISGKEKELIVYCASITCPNSGKLAKRLIDLGFPKVAVYEEGKAEWQNRGFRFEN